MHRNQLFTDSCTLLSYYPSNPSTKVNTIITINNSEMIFVISLSLPYSLAEPDSNNGLFFAVNAFKTLSPLFDCKKHNMANITEKINIAICITVLAVPFRFREYDEINVVAASNPKSNNDRITAETEPSKITIIKLFSHVFGLHHSINLNSFKRLLNGTKIRFMKLFLFLFFLYLNTMITLLHVSNVFSR